jgi:hypothetical protein
MLGLESLIEGSSADGDDKTICTEGCCESYEYVGLNSQHWKHEKPQLG